jgi:Flp pilus assembly protein TadB
VTVAFLVLAILALTGTVAALAGWGHRTARTRDRAQLRDLQARDVERRVALHLLATIRDRASTADQLGNPLGGEITHLIDHFHTTPSE